MLESLKGRFRMPLFVFILCVLLLFNAFPVNAGDPGGAETLSKNPGAPSDFVWVLISGFLVMFMQAGFAFLEAGFSRAKNVANVMMKNLMDFSVGSLAFFAVGFAIMMGSDWNGLMGTDGWFLAMQSYDVTTILIWFFMLVFAATAATICSGAIAERPKFSTYLIYSVVVTAIIYPIYGHWLWGGGWLGNSEFMRSLGGGYGALDFAGSGVVHGIGGYVALAACILLGPRIGKYDENGRPRVIQGHSLAFAVIGVFILWFGWFGFNPGSTLSAHELRISIIAANTNLSASAGAVTSMFITWMRNGKPDVAMTVNGAVGGLVAITAPCAWVAPWSAVLIGVVAGFIAVYGYWWLEKRGVDDVVGAIPVHGFNGTWGIIALGLLADGTYGVYTTSSPLVTGLLYGNLGFFIVQVVSAVVNFAWAFIMGFVLFYVLKKTVGLRVSREEELLGLDITEHATISYPDFTYAESSRGVVIRKGRRSG